MPNYAPNSILVNGNANGNFSDPSQSCCLECGAYGLLQKCKAHCNLEICEDCKQKHWQIEVDDLLKMKTHLENNIGDLKTYLGENLTNKIPVFGHVLRKLDISFKVLRRLNAMKTCEIVSKSSDL